jgi:hypothetical protein
MDIRLVSRRLLYALYMAAFVTIVPAIWAAFFVGHIVVLTLLPQLVSGFLIMFLGAYAAAHVRFLPVRALIVAVVSIVASLYVAPPLGPNFPNFHEHLEIAKYLITSTRSRIFIFAGGVETLILALGAEMLLKLLSQIVERSRKAKPLPG